MFIRKLKGHPEPWCTWGHRQRGSGSKLFLTGKEAEAQEKKVGMLCSSCEFS